jgi:amino acid permease
VLSGSLIVVLDWLLPLCTSHEMAYLILLSIAAAVIAPLSLPRSIGRLGLISTFSTVSFSFLVAVLVWMGATQLVLGTPPSPAVWNNSAKFYAHIGQSSPTLVYAFGCQVQLMAIFHSVSKSLPVEARARKAASHFAPVVWGAVGAMCVLFTATGLFGVCAFPLVDPNAKFDSDVTKLLAGSVIGECSRGALVLAVVTSAPLLVYPARASISSLIVYLLTLKHAEQEDTSTAGGSGGSGERLLAGGKNDQAPAEGSLRERRSAQLTHTLHPFLTVAVVGTAYALAVSVADIGKLVGAMGAFICAPLFFIAPAAALLATPPAHSRRNSPPVIAMCVFLIVVGVAVDLVSIENYLRAN